MNNKYEIVLENTTKIFEGSKVALKDVNLKISSNSVFCLLGPNGAGKTTMVRLINGVLQPTNGKVSVLGKDLSSWNEEINKTCGIVTESSNCYENMTGYENLKFYGNMYGISEIDIEKKINILASKLNISEYIHKKVKTYSSGMRKKIMIGISLINSPKILFLDEPTASLDPESSRDILDFINNLVKNEKVTVFMCTHQLTYAEKIGDCFGFMNNGKLITVLDKKNYDGKVNLNENGWLEKFYFSIIGQEKEK